MKACVEQEGKLAPSERFVSPVRWAVQLGIDALPAVPVLQHLLDLLERDEGPEAVGRVRGLWMREGVKDWSNLPVLGVGE